MKIVGIGDSRLIGNKLVHKLLEPGHQVVAALPSTDANALTGNGVAQALVGAQVLLDGANLPFREVGNLGRL